MSLVQEREQGVEVDRLDQVVVEARLLRAAAGLLLAVAGDGDDDGPPGSTPLACSRVATS